MRCGVGLHRCVVRDGLLRLWCVTAFVSGVCCCVVLHCLRCVVCVDGLSYVEVFVMLYVVCVGCVRACVCLCLFELVV